MCQFFFLDPRTLQARPEPYLLNAICPTHPYTLLVPLPAHVQKSAHLKLFNQQTLESSGKAAPLTVTSTLMVSSPPCLSHKCFHRLCMEFKKTLAHTFIPRL